MLSQAQAHEQQLRRERFLIYIKQGLNSREIGDLEGMDADQARKKRQEYAKEAGLTVSKSERDQFKPIGLAETDRDFRFRLWQEVDRLNRNHSPEQIARLIGVSPAQQKTMSTGKNLHNWTIAQIYRLAVARGLTFRQLIGEANLPDQVPSVKGNKT